MPDSDAIRNRMLAVIAAVVATAALRATFAVAMPVAISILAIAAAWPLKRWLDRWMPSAMSYVCAICALLLVLAGFVAAVYFSIAQVVQVFAVHESRLESAYRPVAGWLRQWGFAFDPARAHSALIGFGQSLLSNVYATFTYLGFIVLLTIFGLPQVPRLRAALRKELTARNRHETVEAVDAIAAKVRRYAATMTATSILTGVASLLWALATGLDLALVWGILNFLLNYIPIIGNAAGAVLPTLYAVLQFHGLTMPALVFAGFAVIQIAVSNIIYPLIQGRSLALSPYALLVSLAFWTWMWGIAGALIAVPITAALTIACEHFAATRWIALLLSSSSQEDGG